MLKPLTLSLSLAVALGLCSVSKAGGHDQNCTTCGLASPQGVVASAQGPVYSTGCETPCAPKHHFSFHMPSFHINLPKIQHQTTYEWVLKKKHCWSIQHAPSCNTCGGGGAAPVYATGQVAPSGQYASGQYAAPQAAAQGSMQVFGAGQRAFMPARSTTSIASVPAEMTPAIPGGEDVPPAPEVRGMSATGSQGGLLLPTPSGN
jgi:hypothetical protein